MSANWLNYIFKHGPRHLQKRFLLVSLADMVRDPGHAWPSVGLIADRCCLSERQTRRLLRELEAEGWLRIVVKRGRKDAGTYVTNDYYLIKPDSIVSGLPADDPPSPEAPKPDNQGTETGHAGHPDRTPEAPKPDMAVSAKPLMNPQKIPTEPCALPVRERPTPAKASANEIIAGFKTRFYGGQGLPDDKTMFDLLIRVVSYAETQQQIAALKREADEAAQMMQSPPAQAR